MKTILLGLLLTFNVYANVYVSQNIRALYRNVQLTEIQKNYILENQDYNINELEKKLKIDIKTLRKKYIDDKNVISFLLTKEGEIRNIKFLVKSDNYKINKITTKAVNESANKLKKPQEDTIIRYIIHFNRGKIEKSNAQYNSTSNQKPFYQNINRGTTRFQHQSEEYVRTFETSKDGFINLSVNPFPCVQRITLLTSNNQKIITVGTYNSNINKEIPKGKYNLLLKTKKLCNVNLEYQ